MEQADWPQQQQQQQEDEDAALLELRTWFEVPAIAHYFHVFRDAYDLIDFDIEDFERTLLCDTQHEACFYPDLLISLLRAWFRANNGADVTLDNYDYYLQDVLNFYNSMLQQHNDVGARFTFAVRYLTPRAKVGILYDMIHWRFDVHRAMEVCSKKLDAGEMRVEPVGADNNGCVYWYFYGSRLYKECLLLSERQLFNVGDDDNDVEVQKITNDGVVEMDIAGQPVNQCVAEPPLCTRKEAADVDNPRCSRPLNVADDCFDQSTDYQTVLTETSSSYDESDAEFDEGSSLGCTNSGTGRKKRRKKSYMLSKTALAKQKKLIAESTSSSESESERSCFFELPTEGIPSDLYEEEEVEMEKASLGCGSLYSWSVSCSTLDEWSDLLDNLRNPTTKNEKVLLKNLEALYEKIPAIVEARERRIVEGTVLKKIKERRKNQKTIRENDASCLLTDSEKECVNGLGSDY